MSLGNVTVTDYAGRELFSYRLPMITGDGWQLKLNAHKDEPRRKTTGRVACLTPTWEKKRGWMNLLLAQWSKQTHRDRLLIIADGSPTAIDIVGPTDDERIIYHHLPGQSLAQRRNFLLEQARAMGSDWFCWFDDDELRDPRWIEQVLVQWDGRAQVVTPPGHIFLDVESGETREFRAPQISLSGALFETERCARYRFPDVFPEDTPWLQAIARSRRVQRLDEFYVWNVAHTDNIGNPRSRIFGGVMTKDYTVGIWRDQPLYISRRDAYSTIDLDKFKAHMRALGVTVDLDADGAAPELDLIEANPLDEDDPDPALADDQTAVASPEDDALTAAYQEADAILFGDADADDEPAEAPEETLDDEVT